MPASLNIRDIGVERKAAIEAEARLRGMSASELVRVCIDDSLARSKAERDRRAWIEAAKQGFEDEMVRLKTRGPTLARFRRTNADKA